MRRKLYAMHQAYKKHNLAGVEATITWRGKEEYLKACTCGGHFEIRVPSETGLSPLNMDNSILDEYVYILLHDVPRAMAVGLRIWLRKKCPMVLRGSKLITAEKAEACRSGI